MSKLEFAGDACIFSPDYPSRGYYGLKKKVL